MRLLTRLTIVLVCLLCANEVAGGEATVSSRRCFEQTTRRAMYYLYLPHRLIIEASETIDIDGRVLDRSRDYLFDYSDGIVYFSDAVPAGCNIRITYMVLPFDLKREYRLWDVDQTYNSKRLVSSVPQHRLDRNRSYDLRASGTKSIHLEVGSLNEFHVSQSLDLKLNGAIGGVEVRAILSDRDMMVGESGSSSRLKDLDRIFMEATASNAYARVGDMEIKESAGDLVGIDRNATGFFFKGYSGSKYFAASGAASRSSSKTVVILTQEGINGPYEIPGSRGSAPILTNSESVYLDGRKLKRGEQGDYTIDYEQGEIYLNPKIAVRSGSRIVVSYDVETGDDKQVYYLAAGTSLGKRARLSFTYLGESSPVGEEQELPLLKSAEMAGWSDGGKFVGAGKGSYVRVTTDSATYYVYVGDGAGDYDVTFTEVGEDRGSYSLIYSEVWQKYIYTYTGKGAFVAMIPPAPTKGSVFHIGALVQPSEWFEIDSEFAQASGVEGDLKGDKDDLRAYEVSMKATTPVLSVGGKSVGSLSASAERRLIGSSYQGFDRKVRPDFYEKWGQEDCSGSEVSNQVTLSYSLHDNLKASAVLGRLETSRGISALRTLEARLKTSRLGLRVTSSRTQVERDSLSWMLAEDVFGLSLPLAFGDFEVGRKYRVRHPTDSLGVRMDKYYCRLETRGSTLRASAQVSHSSEQRKAASTWDDYSSEWEASGRLRLDLARRLSLRAGVIHRILDYRMSDQPDQRLSAADVHLKVRDLSFLSTLAIDYSLSRRLTAIYGWELVRLDGVGDYDSLGNYVPGGGNYGIVNKEMGNEAVNFASLGIDVDLGTRASLIPSGQVSGNLRLRLDAENRSDRFSSYAIPLGNGDDVALATADLRQEIVYRKPSGLSLRLSGHYRSEVDSRYVDRDHARNRLEVGSKVMGRGPVGLSFWLEGRVGKVEATSRVGLVRSRVLKRDWMMGIGLQRSLGGMLRANVNARLFNETRNNPTGKLVRCEVKPQLTLQAKGVRWDNFCRLRKVLRSEGYSIEYYARDSFEWSSRLNLRRGRHVSLSFEYRGLKYQGSSVIHNMRSSLTASF